MLKWPNDLVVGDRKLAGVLCEVVRSDAHVEAIVVGVGCNLSWSEFPAELVGRATACNLEPPNLGSGSVVDRDALLGDFLERLEDRRSRPESIVEDYRRRLSTLGRDVRVEMGDRVVEGVATDIDDTGRLIVAPTDGPHQTIAAGDVIHLRI
jgi:BirA family biotin operon repressor/biotin-[acetyl-CoA-carboxylase] ligase